MYQAKSFPRRHIWWTHNLRFRTKGRFLWASSPCLNTIRFASTLLSRWQKACIKSVKDVDEPGEDRERERKYNLQSCWLNLFCRVDMKAFLLQFFFVLCEKPRVQTINCWICYSSILHHQNWWILVVVVEGMTWVSEKERGERASLIN